MIKDTFSFFECSSIETDNVNASPDTAPRINENTRRNETQRKETPRMAAVKNSLFHSALQVSPSNEGEVTSPEQLAKLRAAFELIDEDNSGTILAE